MPFWWNNNWQNFMPSWGNAFNAWNSQSFWNPTPQMGQPQMWQWFNQQIRQQQSQPQQQAQNYNNWNVQQTSNFPTLSIEQLIQFYTKDKVNLVFIILPFIITLVSAIKLAPYLLNITYSISYYNLFGAVWWNNLIILNYMIFIFFLLWIVFVTFKILWTISRNPALFLIYFLTLWIVSFLWIVLHNLFINILLVFLIIFIIFFDLFIWKFVFRIDNDNMISMWDNLWAIVWGTGTPELNVNIWGWSSIIDLWEDLLQNTTTIEEDNQWTTKLEELFEEINSWLEDEGNVKYLYFDNRTQKIIWVKYIIPENNEETGEDEEDYNDVSFDYVNTQEVDNNNDNNRNSLIDRNMEIDEFPIIEDTIDENINKDENMEEFTDEKENIIEHNIDNNDSIFDEIENEEIEEDNKKDNKKEKKEVKKEKQYNLDDIDDLL